MNTRRGFKILRYFSIASLISLLITAVLLAWLYRQFAIHDITVFGERSNVELARSFLNAVHTELDDYLGDEVAHHSGPLPARVGEEIQRLIKDTQVVQVNIIDNEGVAVFSTEPSKIGQYIGNTGYQLGIGGVIHSQLNYHDRFNLFLKQTAYDNQVRSFIPIEHLEGGGIIGVFSVDTNIQSSVMEIEKTQWQVLLGGLGILSVLYLVLLLIVRHAANIIEQQEQLISERSRSLELLSAQLITAQEDERRRLSYQLHEGVAQSLSGLKFRLEDTCQMIVSDTEGNHQKVNSMVKLVQDTIGEVRTLAMGLRPSSLDDFGVLPTLSWYFRELKDLNPELQIELLNQLEEDEIPKPLKLVMYRVIQERLTHLLQLDHELVIHISLNREDEVIRMSISDNLEMVHIDPDHLQQAELQLMNLRERVVLSGGECRIEQKTGEETSLIAEWLT